MTANNVLHSCTPGTKCAIKIAAPAFGSRLEAAPADLVEKHEPRGDVERQGWNGGPVDGKTAIREDGTIADVSPASRVAHRLGKGVERTRSQEGIS